MGQCKFVIRMISWSLRSTWPRYFTAKLAKTAKGWCVSGYAIGLLGKTSGPFQGRHPSNLAEE